MGGRDSCEGSIICEIVNSVGQGNFTFVREKSGNFRNLWRRFLRQREEFLGRAYVIGEKKSGGLLSPLPSHGRSGRNEIFLRDNRASKIRELAQKSPRASKVKREGKRQISYFHTFAYFALPTIFVGRDIHCNKRVKKNSLSFLSPK